MKTGSKLRWLLGIVAALLLPKCVTCVVGYVALVLGLAAGASEICGADSPVSIQAKFSK